MCCGGSSGDKWDRIFVIAQDDDGSVEVFVFEDFAALRTEMNDPDNGYFDADWEYRIFESNGDAVKQGGVEIVSI